MIKLPFRAGLGLVLYSLTALSFAQSYQITASYQFGDLNRAWITASGAVFGYAADQNTGVDRGFYDLGGGAVRVQSLGGQSASVAGVTSTGIAYGSAQSADGKQHAVTYSNGTPTIIPGLDGVFDYIVGMNASGTVVGIRNEQNYAETRSTVVKDGVATDLGTVGGGSRTRVVGINDAGQITGSASGSNLFDHAVRWENGVLTDIGLGYGNAINASGAVVGIGQTDMATVWENGVVRSLGTIAGTSHSRAFAVNDLGDVVGDTVTLGSGRDHSVVDRPFIYRNGQMRHLDELVNLSGTGLRLMWARGISNDGRIAVSGFDANNRQVSVILTPNPVPEPTTLAALGLGAAAMFRRRKRA